MLADAVPDSWTEGKIAVWRQFIFLVVEPAIRIEGQWIFEVFLFEMVGDDFDADLHTFFHGYFPNEVIFTDFSDGQISCRW